MAQTSSANRTETAGKAPEPGASAPSQPSGAGQGSAGQGSAGDGQATPPADEGRGSAKLPLIAGATALAGLAGWIVVAGRSARRTVLGLRLPRVGSRSARQVVSDGAREVGGTVGRLPGVARLRQRIGR